MDFIVRWIHIEVKHKLKRLHKLSEEIPNVVKKKALLVEIDKYETVCSNIIDSYDTEKYYETEDALEDLSNLINATHNEYVKYMDVKL